MVNMQTKICGHILDFCVWNASGPLCSTSRQLAAIERSAAGAVQAKSATKDERKGNPFPRYAETAIASINSEGLPNKGIDYYLECTSVCSQGSRKPFVISISGLKQGENEKMLERISRNSDVSWVEINLSCPNIPGKPLVAYDMEQFADVLESVMRFTAHPIGIKLPPYLDMVQLKDVATLLNKHPVSFVVCANTMGNGLILDTSNDLPTIAPKGGHGGIAGTVVKPINLANVRTFRKLLRDDIAIIGAGGVTTGRDVYEYILCGADAVQVATQFRKEGPKLFARLESELREIMISKGYDSLSQFRGKLQSRL